MSEKSAKTKATIQKRMMICGSFQPMSSKWWWRGAMRKIRLPRSLKEPDLQHHREGLDHEEAAHEEEQQLLLDEEGHGAEGAPQGEAAHVAHEDLGGIAVPPQEAHGGAHHGPAEDRDLPRPGLEEEVEVVGEDARGRRRRRGR